MCNCKYFYIKKEYGYCKALEDLIGQNFSPHKEYCEEKCKGNGFFAQQDMGTRHILGLCFFPNMPIQDFAKRSKRIIGNDLAKNVLLNAAISGYYSEEDLLEIAKELNLK